MFHDDQHGTAIVAAAGLINACHLTGRDLRATRLVINGAGAAAIACAELLKAMGMHPSNVALCDMKGVVYRGGTDGTNQWKSVHASANARAHAEGSCRGQRHFLPPLAKGAMTPGRSSSMAAKPIIFAMANPDPEITPEAARGARPEVIIATGRSDYPNQVNNVLGFPYIFRGALDVRASTINDEMKIAAAEALAQLAREDVPDEVNVAGGGKRLQFGARIHHSECVRSAPDLAPAAGGGEGGDGQRRGAPRRSRICANTRANCRAGSTDRQCARCDHGERARRAAGAWCSPRARRKRWCAPRCAFRNAGYGTPVLIGREDRVRATHGDAWLRRGRTASKSTTRGCRATTSATPSSSMRGCNGAAS